MRFFLSVFFSVEDAMTGKRIYITASTAKEHTHKLWQNEGKRVFETSQKQLQVSKLFDLLSACQRNSLP